jgi:hypothetical protein
MLAKVRAIGVAAAELFAPFMYPPGTKAPDGHGSVAAKKEIQLTRTVVLMFCRASLDTAISEAADVAQGLTSSVLYP